MLPPWLGLSGLSTHVHPFGRRCFPRLCSVTCRPNTAAFSARATAARRGAGYGLVPSPAVRRLRVGPDRTLPSPLPNSPTPRSARLLRARSAGLGWCAQMVHPDGSAVVPSRRLPLIPVQRRQTSARQCHLARSRTSHPPSPPSPPRPSAAAPMPAATAQPLPTAKPVTNFFPVFPFLRPAAQADQQQGARNRAVPTWMQALARVTDGSDAARAVWGLLPIGSMPTRSRAGLESTGHRYQATAAGAGAPRADAARRRRRRPGAAAARLTEAADAHALEESAAAVAAAVAGAVCAARAARLAQLRRGAAQAGAQAALAAVTAVLAQSCEPPTPCRRRMCHLLTYRRVPKQAQSLVFHSSSHPSQCPSPRRMPVRSPPSTPLHPPPHPPSLLPTPIH